MVSGVFILQLVGFPMCWCVCKGIFAAGPRSLVDKRVDS